MGLPIRETNLDEMSVLDPEHSEKLFPSSDFGVSPVFAPIPTANGKIQPCHLSCNLSTTPAKNSVSAGATFGVLSATPPLA